MHKVCPGFTSLLVDIKDRHLKEIFTLSFDTVKNNDKRNVFDHKKMHAMQQQKICLQHHLALAAQHALSNSHVFLIINDDLK